MSTTAADEHLDNFIESHTETIIKALSRAFVLDSNSEWVVVATGVTVTELSEDGQVLTASLHDEVDTNTILFSTSFHKDQDIVRQQATVVTWTSADGSDVALSFENEVGLDHFWYCEYSLN
jgi:hypothetical protein